MKIAVLGVGRVGGAIAADLAKQGEFDVTAVDRSESALEAVSSIGGVSAVEADLADADRLAELARGQDMVVGAAPASLGYRTVETVVDTGTPIVDISFFEEDPFALDDLARARGVPAVVDAGIAPGLSNLIFGAVGAMSESVDRFVCYVGGLPVDRSGLFQYKAPFSPADVIELYTRPARYVDAGEQLSAPALSMVEEVRFPDFGVLEAFITDGLRTLLHGATVPHMREMTLRYPGHADQVRLLRDLGLFSKEPIAVGGVTVSPIKVTSRLLFPLWKYEPGEEDVTVFRVEVDAVEDGGSKRHVYEILDRYDAVTGTSSMARTTGYVCTALVRLVASGGYSVPGITAPETLGRVPGCLDRVTRQLAARGVSLSHTLE